ncbi:MAG: hypothetical protein JSU64_03335 [candidate division WOR-3 bacterium]|nr:MAG: hypothetical protein JSU64_03335 [candidate division WOR-3 bacterium]
MRTKYLLALMLLAISCRERINPYDPGNEDFSTPPSLYMAYPVLGWYNTSGYLVGLRMRAEFVDPFDSPLEITIALFMDEEELARDSVPVAAGADTMIVDMFSTVILDFGLYHVLLYWAEFPIGNSLFEIINDGGQMVIQGVTEYDTLPEGNSTLLRKR